MATLSQCTLLSTTFSHSVPEKRRPPWLDPDPKPPDLDNARKALLYQHNPNQPHSPDKLRAERLGLSTRPLHRRSLTAPAQMGVERASVDKVRKNIMELKQHDGDGYSHCLKLYRAYSISFNLPKLMLTNFFGVEF